MALGTRYPYGRRSDSGADEREIGSGGPVKAGSNYESTSPGSSAGTEVPWSVFSPSMASFLKRTANASFVPRLLSIGPSMSRSVGQPATRWTYYAQTVQVADFVPQATDNDDYRGMQVFLRD